ncbi:MAG: hypothetical protein IV100_01915 [Myxococcales bacterium]|nr:hypothetical protein [Myxococcales bacterium]
MTTHLTLVTSLPSVEPLFPLFQTTAPLALFGLMAATLVQPLTDGIVRPVADALEAGAKASFAAAQRPVRAFDAKLERMRQAFRSDDGQ